VHDEPVALATRTVIEGVGQGVLFAGGPEQLEGGGEDGGRGRRRRRPGARRQQPGRVRAAAGQPAGPFRGAVGRDAPGHQVGLSGDDIDTDTRFTHTLYLPHRTARSLNISSAIDFSVDSRPRAGTTSAAGGLNAARAAKHLRTTLTAPSTSVA